MAKGLDSPYSPGKHSRYWLKIKEARNEEFEILGDAVGTVSNCIESYLIGRQQAGAFVLWACRRWIQLKQSASSFFESLQVSAPLLNPPKGGPIGLSSARPEVRCLERFFEETDTARARSAGVC